MSLTEPRPGRSWKLVVLVAAAAIVIVVMAYEALVPDGKNLPPPAELIFRDVPATFAPGIHVLGALSPSVAYVVETPDGLVLIDSGLEDGYDLILQQFKLLGLDIHQVKFILITHCHGDHFLGANRIRQVTGAQVWAGQGDSGILRSGGPREAVFSTFPMDHIPLRPTAVDRELAGGEVIQLGNVTLRVLATPGHTPGSTCYLFERDGTRALFTGDTLMTLAGDLGTYATHLPPRYRGDAKSYLATLQELKLLTVPDLLLPGHPLTGDRPVSPRLSPDEWQALLDKGIHELTTLLARYAADGEDFLDGTARELLPGLHYLGDVEGQAVYVAIRGGDVVLLDGSARPGVLDRLEQELPRIGASIDQLKALILTEVSPESTAGLAEFVEQTGALVGVPGDGLEAFRKLVPSIEPLPVPSLSERISWLPLTEFRLQGTGRPRSAYLLEWGEQPVLLTGRAPLKLASATRRQFQELRADPAEYLKSLVAPGRVSPRLWLPGIPVHGQNANLYESEWTDALREVRMVLTLPQ